MRLTFPLLRPVQTKEFTFQICPIRFNGTMSLMQITVGTAMENLQKRNSYPQIHTAIQ